jgi:uncharacterized protein YfaS (alpha-2-macroglobulin family)
VPEVLAKARKLQPVWLPSEPPFAKTQSFRFEAGGGRALFVRIDEGAKAYGDYALVKPWATVLQVAEFPQAVEILHEGSVLALSGGRKLSYLSRNLRAVEVELSRLLPGSIAHLSSQTEGTFQQPNFESYGFDLDNLSEVFRDVRPTAPGAPGDPQYDVVDFGAKIASGAEPRGLFQLRVSGWDPETKKRIDGVESRRIVLVTDLGFLVKDAADGTHDVFVVSVATGTPVAGATVELLGKNGLPVLSRVTDENGARTCRRPRASSARGRPSRGSSTRTATCPSCRSTGTTAASTSPASTPAGSPTRRTSNRSRPTSSRTAASTARARRSRWA